MVRVCVCMCVTYFLSTLILVEDIGNGNPEEFLLFVQNSQMNIDASVSISVSANIWYLHTLLCGEVLRQFDMLSVEVGSMTAKHLNRNILGVGTHFFLICALSKKSVRYAA